MGSGALHGQHLHGFGKDELAIHTLGRQETDLAGGRVKLVQALEGAALPIRDPVIAEITEQDGLGPGLDFRHEGGSVLKAQED